MEKPLRQDVVAPLAADMFDPVEKPPKAPHVQQPIPEEEPTPKAVEGFVPLAELPPGVFDEAEEKQLRKLFWAAGEAPPHLKELPIDEYVQGLGRNSAFGGVAVCRVRCVLRGVLCCVLCDVRRTRACGVYVCVCVCVLG